MRRFFTFVSSICFVMAAFAWEAPRQPVVIGAQSLNLRVMREGKAQKERKFELHKAITFDLEKARRTGAFDKNIVKPAITDSLGLLSFGKVKPGRYWIVPAGGLVTDSIAVEVTAPNGKPSQPRVRLTYNAEGDLSVSVEYVDHSPHDSETKLDAKTH